MKLLLDEMWSAVVAQQLRLRGHDVVAVLEREDLIEKSDRLIFETARREGRAVVSENGKDFRNLASEYARYGRNHAGIIVTLDSRFPRGHGRGLGRLITALDALLTSGEDFTNREHWLS